MAGRLVFEVRQRSKVDPLQTRELGLFSDDMLADNAINWLYQKAWSLIVKPSFLGSEWFPFEMREAISGSGFDRWKTDDSNSTEPTFFKVPHTLYTKVPTINDALMFDTDTLLVTVGPVDL